MRTRRSRPIIGATRASDLFGDRQEQLQQKLETTSGADLGALAKEFGLTLGEVPDYTRGGGGALGVNPDLTTVVFSDTVLKDQRIGGPVALADDRLVIVKVLEHHPAKATAAGRRARGHQRRGRQGRRHARPRAPRRMRPSSD